MQKNHLSMLALILMLFTFSSVQAQTDCTIDLSQVIVTLAEAQSSNSSGDQQGALSGIAEAQSALLAIQSACGVLVNDIPEAAVASVTLPQTYVAPNLYFTVDIPEGASASSFTGNSSEHVDGGAASLASFVLSDQRTGFNLAVGEPSAMISLLTANVTAELNIPDTTDFTSVYEFLYEYIRVTSRNVVIGLTEVFQFADERTGFRIAAVADGYSRIVVGIALDEERIAVIQFIGAADQAVTSMAMAEAIVSSVR
jgi:hypothetical protein